MNLLLLQAALERALAHPAIQADIAACPVGVTLVLQPEAPAAAQRIELQPARDGAGEIACYANASLWAQTLAPPAGGGLSVIWCHAPQD